MSIWPVLDAVEQIDMTLMSELSWAGGRAFPFAGSHDVAISADTTWSDIAGFRKARKLTIAAGATLRIIRSPFFIFADEIEFGGATSCIDISGVDGNTPYDPLAIFAMGGGAGATSYGGGGAGGGLLIIAARAISGTIGKIKANGGQGLDGVGSSSTGGQGALSRATGVQYWDGSRALSSSTAVNAYLHPLAWAMANGGGSTSGAYALRGQGGGGGGGSNAYGGGSGIGGGGASNSDADGSPGLAPHTLIKLALAGCLGGGGGGCYSQKGGGGGGGGIALFYRQASSLPVLEANGGTAVSGGDGGAGVTTIVQV